MKVPREHNQFQRRFFMKRRDFLKKAGIGVAAAAGITGLVGCAKEE
jgi:hypothetical protein